MQSYLPPQLIQSLQGLPGFEEAAFIKVHEEREAVTSIRFQPQKLSSFLENYSIEDTHLPISQLVSWSANAFYLRERPSFTFDPLFHAGFYYVQEASSMFLWEILKQTIGENTKDKKVLDLCAAPGGKSTLLASYFADGFVVSNEVIKSRATILAENITKWGMSHTIVTNNDPAHFKKLPAFFDVLVIDAPCSGSGLFRKDKEAVEEWSEEAVRLCSGRQQRILADAYDCLQQNGILVYSTCSYSVQEDEEILDWLMGNFNLQPLSIQLQSEWHIIETHSTKHKAYGYRFYPDKLKGEGFFIAAFVKHNGHSSSYYATPSLTLLSKKETEIWQDWITDKKPLSFIKQKESVLAIPSSMQSFLALLQKALYIKQAGTNLGEIKGKDVIPNQALAVSTLTNSFLQTVPFKKEQAIQYLQKKEISIDVSSFPKGWHLGTYCGIPLGWLKVLPNRINNYYPSEWRILKN